MTDTEARARLSRAKSAWLEAQSAAWVSAGLIEDESRRRILASYDVESAERRGLMALMILGALMFGIGVLLLIGYNWARLPVPGKIAIIMASVAIAFGSSAAAFARRHRTAGETLAFIGVLLYGNAIWLIAQVLNIQGNFSDAFLWWGIGALACAWLVRSRAIGAGAAVLVLIWVLAAGHTLDRPMFVFLAVWASLLFVAYQQRSAVILVPAAVALVAWVCWVPERVQPGTVSVGAAAIMGCAFYAIGAWHRPTEPLGRAWQITGLAVLLVFVLPLLVRGFHSDSHEPRVTWRALAVVVPAIIAAGSLPLRRARQDALVAGPWLADAAILATAGAVAVWLGFLAAGRGGDATWAYGMTMTFSVLALTLSASLIHKALQSDSAPDLMFGVFFGLAFLLVRWASLIDSMLWSGVMLLAASGGFFAIARLWRHRDRRPRPTITPVITGAVR